MDSGNAPAKDEREPYEPPAVISEVVFETLAMQCGKTDTQVAVCNPAFGGMLSSS